MFQGFSRQTVQTYKKVIYRGCMNGKEATKTSFRLEKSLMANDNHLITGHIVQVCLPSDDRFKKIFLEINSKFTQIGEENKVTGLDIPRNRRIRRLDVDSSESETCTTFIQANAVQLSVGSNKLLEIEVKSDEAYLLQTGDQCNINLRNESKVKVNNHVDMSSGCRRESFAGSTRSVKRRKLRKRQPDNKTESSPKKENPETQTSTASIDSPDCLKLCREFFDKVQRILHPLRDNGNWRLFDEKWKELSEKYGKYDIWKALLKLELGIRISYDTKFDSPPSRSYQEVAEETLREGWKIIEGLTDINPSIRQFFKGRCSCYFSSVYRKQPRCQGRRVQQALEAAEKIFNNTASTNFLYDKAMFFYEKGSRYHEFDKKGVDNKQAKESFEKCYNLCRQVRKETGCDFIEKGQFALLKKVMVLLGCSTKEGRLLRKITDKELAEAKKCIEEFDKENETRSPVPISLQLQLFLAKSDSYFRMNDFANAEEKVLQAVDLADQHGFDSGPARKRLHDIIEVRQAVGEPKPNQQNHSKIVDHLVTCDANSSGLDHRVSCEIDISASQSTGTSD